MTTTETMNYLINSAEAPKIDNPTDKQKGQLIIYWNMVMKHISTILFIREKQPNWLPDFNSMF